MIVVAAALVLAAPAALATETVELEFTDAPLSEILVALGSATATSIVVDESVTGSTSHYFAARPFEEALAAFAAQHGLFVDRVDGVYRVSAVRVTMPRAGAISVEARSVALPALVRALSRETRTPILFERLPELSIAYFTDGATLGQILTHLGSLADGFELVERDGAYLFARSTPGSYDTPSGATAAGAVGVTLGDDGYSISVGQAPLGVVLEALFAESGSEFQLLKRISPTIGPFAFAGKRFDELLGLVLERADGAYALVDGIYYITDAAPHAAIARSLVTRAVELRHVQPSALLDLLPPEQTSDVALRADRSGERITVTGNPASVDRVTALIGELDAAPTGHDYHRVELQSIDPASLPALLPRHLASIPMTAAGWSSVIARTTAERAEELRRFVDAIDIPGATTLIELEHIRVDELPVRLSGVATRSVIVETGDPTRFFFHGTQTELAAFRRELEAVDRPAPQISYQLLIVQYRQGETLDWDVSLSNSLSTPDSTHAFLAGLGNLLSLSFDIVSTFGYQFALRLNSSIGSASASILADTTLTGLSGREVSFQNTSTFRFRDAVIDPDSGEVKPTGVIREITSGLTLGISGWVGASDSVTMEVTATVSRRGTDGVAKGNPPPTSEKVIRTQVRTTAGSPVVLSGLIQRDEERSTRETPLLGRIPLIGWLFRSEAASEETTELAIYIVPRIDRGEPDDEATARRLLDLYERYARGSR